jgi:hypothetical protein
VRHGGKINVAPAQLHLSQTALPPGATTQLDSAALQPPRLRVFNQQNKLIAIAEAVIPRTYQPIVVFDPLP